MWFVTYI